MGLITRFFKNSNKENTPLPLSRFRIARFKYISLLINRSIEENGKCSIIDLGGTPEYWSSLAFLIKEKKINVTIVNLKKFTSEEKWISCIQKDATNLKEFSDNSFDLVHSNSTVEHLGSWKKMKDFASETRRLAPSYYIQTPNFWFPYEFHTRLIGFHWLPKSCRIKILMKRANGYYPRANTVAEAMSIIKDAHSLTYKEMNSLFPDSKIIGERFCGLNKSWISIRSKTTAATHK
ncbi:class I SAM-dependent methyltransferase [Acetobacter sp.]|jgi:hypothetical protein|uniref:class I SAM-dependent methyltransferase n=1 Tax=Acetobacter sp. TaxID=440 RepID=UPI0025C4EBEE|nr:class I SAM-dependent methyltransferase [Acetobacter sp.]MCH4090587.1 class I SAM-dependent methyltransferase [Acetobacter sp.]MCI1300030.1 class I SAM-dependent methyltransferase [Acetobacter sp.]MCI1316448.1 class I SAM-dependent methyltransferase [Acetobacter sp.]